MTPPGPARSGPGRRTPLRTCSPGPRSGSPQSPPAATAWPSTPRCTSRRRNPDGSDDGLGLNTAILVSPEGELLARTHKLHIPVTAGYYEDKFFRQGPAAADAYEVHAPAELGGARLGMPTCWDEWFPEVARLYSLGGAEILVYPTAIGSEPDHPDFDTQPLWQQVIVGNGIANGLFMIAPNRWGSEGTLNFYGSSFISDPYGRDPGPGPARRVRRPGGRPGPGPAPGLAHALPVPGHPPPRHLRPAHRTRTP